MLSNEILKVSTATEWAVIDPFNASRKRAEHSIETCEQHRVKYGKRVNGLHYSFKTRNGRSWSESADDFAVTESRSYGFLFEMLQPNGDKFYAVVRPANFIAPKKDYREYWDAESERRVERARLAKEAQEEQARLQEIKNKIRADALAVAQPQMEHAKDSLLVTIQSLLGIRAMMLASVSMSLDGTWTDEDTDTPKYDAKQTGRVTLDLEDFKRLLNKAMQD